VNAVIQTVATNRTGEKSRLRRRVARSVLLLIVAFASRDVRAVPTCTVASSATLSFGAVVALASTGDVATNSGSTFWINCTSDVSTTPALYSAGARILASGGHTLPFMLSEVAAGGAELPAHTPGTPLGIVKNGANQTVTLYGKIQAADFKALPSGFYSGTITLTVEY